MDPGLPVDGLAARSFTARTHRRLIRSRQQRKLLSTLRMGRAAQVMGLVLLAALQRRRRGIHISSMLRPDEVKHEPRAPHSKVLFALG